MKKLPILLIVCLVAAMLLPGCKHDIPDWWMGGLYKGTDRELTVQNDTSGEVEIVQVSELDSDYSLPASVAAGASVSLVHSVDSREDDFDLTVKKAGKPYNFNVTGVKGKDSYTVVLYEADGGVKYRLK